MGNVVSPSHTSDKPNKDPMLLSALQVKRFRSSGRLLLVQVTASTAERYRLAAMTQANADGLVLEANLQAILSEYKDVFVGWGTLCCCDMQRGGDACTVSGFCVVFTCQCCLKHSLSLQDTAYSVAGKGLLLAAGTERFPVCKSQPVTRPTRCL
jgi:hypothetical protein